jgi:hypothetical protein
MVFGTKLHPLIQINSRQRPQSLAVHGDVDP